MRLAFRQPFFCLKLVGDAGGEGRVLLAGTYDRRATEIADVGFEVDSEADLQVRENSFVEEESKLINRAVVASR